MKNQNHSIFTCFLLILNIGLFAQSDIRIGEWESHLSHQRSNWLTQSAEFLYISSGSGLIKIAKEEIQNGALLSPDYITKIEGLSESQIDKVAYDNFNNQLIITYQSSNIDIVTENEIINIPFIKDNTNIVGSRSINDIHIADAQTCYFAGAFGIINMDLEKLEFKYTTFTPGPVLSVTSDVENVYVGLEDGMYKISKDDVNPIDFSRWRFQSSEVGLSALYSCPLMVEYNDDVFAVIDDSLFQLKNGTFESIDLDMPSGYQIQFLSAERAHLLVGLRNDATKQAEIRIIGESGNIRSGGADCINELIYGIELEDGSIWYADGFREIRYTEGFNYGCKKITFNSPRSNNCSQIEVKGDQVFFASGGASDNYALLSNREGIYILENNNWENVNEAIYPEINEKFYLNFVSVAPHPKENIVYMSSYYTGIVKFDIDTKELEFYDADNSKLQGTNPSDSRARVAYAMFDDEENLWMANFASPDPIVVMTKEGDWHHFDIPFSNTNLAKMAIDDNGYVWYTIIGNNGGVLVYDKGERIADPTDDRYRIFTSTDSELPSPLVNSIAVDLDGDVWVGTSQGPVAFECDVFDDECIGSRRKVLQDSIAAFLLDSEEILAIEIDGADRKWFGTKNGIFVQSPDGEIQEERFTIDNSPLFNNTIVDLDFDEVSGRMYISTNDGIQSIRTETTGAKRRHDRPDVYAFPNPVSPDYDGPIAIKGLGRDANVKITDLNGKLVFETTALGGQAIWNGRDYTGRRVATGVYLVFSSSKVSFEESDDYVTKIMVLD